MEEGRGGASFTKAAMTALPANRVIMPFRGTANSVRDAAVVDATIVGGLVSFEVMAEVNWRLLNEV